MLLCFQEPEEAYINFPDILVNFTCARAHTHTKEKIKSKKIAFATTARNGGQENARTRLLPAWLG